MYVLVIPNRVYPPAEDALDLADAVLTSVKELTPEIIERVG
jgi:hypothetical protein